MSTDRVSVRLFMDALIDRGNGVCGFTGLDSRAMRWSQLFIPTLRDDPADAEATSHRLMLRAGLIRQLGAGIYSKLPLAERVARKVEAIVREEMDADRRARSSACRCSIRPSRGRRAGAGTRWARSCSA